jgi:hypothetical protein
VLQEMMPGVLHQLGLGWERFNLGRYFDDYRDNQKIWGLLRNGKLDPEAAGIPHITEMERVIGLVCDRMNSRRVNGRQFSGVPQEAWEAHLGERGIERPLTEAQWWLFSRGLAERKVTHLSISAEFTDFFKTWYLFTAPWFAGLGEGYRLTARFDPADPTRAAIYNREGRDASKVREYLVRHWPISFADKWTLGQMPCGLAEGEFIGFADLSPEAPYFARGKTREMERLGKVAHEFQRFARIQCSILGPRGARPLRFEESHDGRGNIRLLTREQQQDRAAQLVAAADRVSPIGDKKGPTIEDGGRRTAAIFSQENCPTGGGTVGSILPNKGTATTPAPLGERTTCIETAAVPRPARDALAPCAEAAAVDAFFDDIPY